MNYQKVLFVADISGNFYRDTFSGWGCTMDIPKKMLAMVMEKPGRPLRALEVPVPQPGTDQILIRVHTCGVCHTDLHIIDNELPNPKLPLIPGHEIIGTVAVKGKNVSRFKVGDRVGVPWMGFTDNTCKFCLRGQENLCDNARFTGYTIDGGYAEYAVAYESYCFHVPELFGDQEGAPLLCAGLIGYRTYRMAGSGIGNLGIYGFGAAAHIITQVASYEGVKIYAFTRRGDTEAKDFARSKGAVWAGDSTESPPEKLDAAIIFAPVGALVPKALKAVDKGGAVVSGGIHMSDIPSFPYNILWQERSIRSVANLTRRDGEEFFKLAPLVPVKTTVQVFPLVQANEVLDRLRNGQIEGAGVLSVFQP
jgi:alcohol dehydrogenase, propanol-preferring